MTLIDQALAAVAAAPTPKRLGVPIEITPEQGLVWSIYGAIVAKRRGWGGSDAEIERCVRTATSLSIPEAEIQAAIAAAEAVDA